MGSECSTHGELQGTAGQPMTGAHQDGDGRGCPEEVMCKLAFPGGTR